jgi:uncharacterized protein
VVALLDVSVLIPLFDAAHVHHDLAHDWFDQQRRHGWATCPVTENGFVRLATSAAYSNPPLRPADVVARLDAFRRSGRHEFWTDSVSIADERIFNAAHIRGSKQITDAYLLGLAAANGGALATFDRSVQVAAVKGATKANLMVISADPGAATFAGR